MVIVSSVSYLTTAADAAGTAIAVTATAAAMQSQNPFLIRALLEISIAGCDPSSTASDTAVKIGTSRG